MTASDPKPTIGAWVRKEQFMVDFHHIYGHMGSCHSYATAMIIKFKHAFSLRVEEVYSYFQTPAQWVQLYGLAGEVKDLGEGWYAVPLKKFPFPLVAKTTVQIPNELVQWIFRGFWRGRGEVRFTKCPERVIVEGYEEIAVRWLFFLSPLIEYLFLERVFRSIWEIGWHRLRKRETEKAS